MFDYIVDGLFPDNGPDVRSESHYALWHWNLYKDMLASKRFACNTIRNMKWF